MQKQSSTRDIVLVKIGFHDPTIVTHIHDDFSANQRTVRETKLQDITLSDLAAYLKSEHPRPAHILLEPGTLTEHLNMIREYTNNNNVTIGTKKDFRYENN